MHAWWNCRLFYGSSFVVIRYFKRMTMSASRYANDWVSSMRTAIAYAGVWFWTSIYVDLHMQTSISLRWASSLSEATEVDEMSSSWSAEEMYYDDVRDEYKLEFMHASIILQMRHKHPPIRYRVLWARPPEWFCSRVESLSPTACMLIWIEKVKRFLL